MPVDPFSFDPPSSLLRRAAFGAARPLLSKVLHLNALRELYALTQKAGDAEFFDRVLRVLHVHAQFVDEGFAQIPAQGPLIVVANHPRGALDGIVLAALLKRVRGDVRLLANYLLARIPELGESSFFVDPFAGPEAAARSRAGLRAAHLWLRHGGALVAFPSGEVAHQRRDDGSPIDAVWKETAARLAVQTGARVLPVFVDGSNSDLFYAAGRIHPALRTLLLPRELLHQRGKGVSVAVGEPLETRGLAPDTGMADALTLRAREAVDRLADRSKEIFVQPPDESLVEREVSRLSGDLLMVESGTFQVFCAPASAIPATLREIGRLRAVTYRAAGEGTDAEIDLDAFDEHYLHLFSWDRRARRIVGAYRLGLTDRILDARGVEGLYTRTLFVYDAELLKRLPAALELGRSFVRVEYQRHHQALLLLWKGIGRFVARHPQYRVLFGPVSISARYSNASHGLLASFLEQNHLDSDLSAMVQPMHPFTRPSSTPSALRVVPRSVEETDRFVSTLERDGKGMPVLLRQYLKLNARVLGLNVDRAFGDVLDALMLIDLASVDVAILSRYLGREDAAMFLACHAAATPSRAA